MGMIDWVMLVLIIYFTVMTLVTMGLMVILHIEISKKEKKWKELARGIDPR